MTFSTNQARQFYVAKNVVTGENEVSTLGDIKVVRPEGSDCIYFQHVGQGGVTRSDLIPVKSITYAKATAADKMAINRQTLEVTLNSAVNSGSPVAAQHYILKVNYSQFVGMSDEDTYFEMAEVLATTGMSASDFYKALALSLAKSDAKQGLVEVRLGTSGADVVVAATTKAADLTGTYTKVKITAAPAEWTLGKKAYAPAQFTLTASPIISGAVEVEPLTFAVGTAAPDGNGKAIADLEYFCMGERADVYRGAGWPNNIETAYMVDASKTYDVIDIHYAYQGTCEDIQKSEKDITIVCDSASSHDIATDLIGAINAVTDTIIAAETITVGEVPADEDVQVGESLLNTLS